MLKTKSFFYYLFLTTFYVYFTMLSPKHHFEYGSFHRYSNMCPLTCTFQNNIIVIDGLLVSMLLREFFKTNSLIFHGKFNIELLE